jgi:glutamate/tyrosine decarboxylase-like PLP-dependent enzyme
LGFGNLGLKGLLVNRNLKGRAHDRRTDEVIAAIQKTGEAFFGGTTWHGRRPMRVSLCNWQTSDQDVERVVKAVAIEARRR